MEECLFSRPGSDRERKVNTAWPFFIAEDHLRMHMLRVRSTELPIREFLGLASLGLFGLRYAAFQEISFVGSAEESRKSTESGREEERSSQQQMAALQMAAKNATSSVPIDATHRYEYYIGARTTTSTTSEGVSTAASEKTSVNPVSMSSLRPTAKIEAKKKSTTATPRASSSPSPATHPISELGWPG